MGDGEADRDRVPTVIARPSRPDATPRPTLGPTMTVAPLTTERALAEVEGLRMRGLMSGVCLSAAATALLVIAIGGDPVAMRIHASALGATSVAAGLTWLLLRNPKPRHTRLALYVVIAQLGVLLSGYYFWGVFSAYGSLVPVTVYIAAGNASKVEAILGGTALIVAQGGFQLATSLGWIESRGLLEPVPERVPLSTQLVAIVLLQVITIGAMLAGRAARRKSADVLDAHNRALVELARREALLAEAYADARAAQEAGAGHEGRFTGQAIDGFELGHVLGRGAMGEIYAARRLADDTQVAIKILATHLLRDPVARERFLRESAIVSSLKSRHVVQVLAVAPADALLPYIAMERLVGTDLGHLLKRGPVPPLAEVVEMIEQIADGLDAAHAAGVIHRDLKPSNLFLTDARIWKILDFGASRWHDGEGTLTRDRVIGTPGFMAPEQALGRPVDKRGDVYSLGVIVYRMVTGVPAVVPGEMPAMLHEVTYRMPVQPSLRAASVTPAVEAVIAISLAKDPAQRFATAGDFARSMRAAAEDRLDPALLARAEAVLREMPWGTWTRVGGVRSIVLHR